MTTLLILLSGLALGLVYARLIPALLAIRQSRRKQARAWDAFEADVPADYDIRDGINAFCSHGHEMQLIGPGEWQCVECERDYHSRVQDNAHKQGGEASVHLHALGAEEDERANAIISSFWGYLDDLANDVTDEAGYY